MCPVHVVPLGFPFELSASGTAVCRDSGAGRRVDSKLVVSLDDPEFLVDSANLQ